MSSLKKLLAAPPLKAATKKFNQTKLWSSCGSGGTQSNEQKYSKRMIRFKKLQEFFQRDDGKPIFLKCGARDRLLYLSTVGLGLVGLVLDFQYYAGYIFDKK